MPTIPYSRSPKVQRGAILQIADPPAVLNNTVVAFQYNPASLKRGLKPWNPVEVDHNQKGQNAPDAQPFDPEESINIDIELDASDQLEDDDPIADTFGVMDRIAALEKMLFPATPPFTALLAEVTTLLGGTPQPPERKTVPVTLFIFGAGRMVPVRITSYQIEEQLFLPSLYPVQAKVTLGLQVVTPDMFKALSTPAVEIAKAVYTLFRTQQDALALLRTAKDVAAAIGLLPF
jgi:hypothetical protein